jgi:hypothetical protein
VTALSLEQLGVITEAIPCRECGTVTVVYALGWEAMPDVGNYVGSCCRKYIGDIDWEQE